MTIMHWITVVVLALAMVACTTPPQRQAIDINSPVDAFDSVAPSAEAPRGGGLSSDVQNLQNAHRLYEQSRKVKRNKVTHSQQACMQQSDSRKVHIQGPGGGVYCQPPAGE